VLNPQNGSIVHVNPYKQTGKMSSQSTRNTVGLRTTRRIVLCLKFEQHFPWIDIHAVSIQPCNSSKQPWGSGGKKILPKTPWFKYFSAAVSHPIRFSCLGSSPVSH